MLKNFLLDLFSEGDTRPNNFTIGMGKLIKLAREEAGYNQRDLANLINRRQAALSDMENGKMEPDASTLLALSFYLEKPITYFYPNPWKPESKLEKLSDDEKELLILAARLSKDDLRKLVAQVKALADISKDEENFK